MSSKRLAGAAAAVAVLVLAVVGLLELPGASPSLPPARLTLAQMQARLAGSPPALASLHAQANQILSGGLPALRARLAILSGTPMVINKWASWCQPCRAEFGVFQRVSISLGSRVAFLGIDSGETSRGNALTFLRSYPVSYPSYYDESGQAGTAITGSPVTPVTVFYNAQGRRFIHQGPFLSVSKLEQAIKLYALGV